ncbi:MAG: ATP synthase F0 subunit B [Deltaproteobacteria bacterium]|jgi:F-type H+-transporting ATPase subunit b|nr:ATP synthase F0 subunit B [Deltaproteobacteria bacterium]
MQIISNVALISINETLIVQVISFLIFLFIINRIMFRPLRNVMNDRKSHINKIQQDIVNAQSKYETLTDQIERHEINVRNEAFKQKQQLEASGLQEAAGIMAATRKEIEASRASAKKAVNDQIAAARQQVQKEAEGLASKIIAKVLFRSQTS